MNVDRIVMATAGSAILLSTGLAYYYSLYWLVMTGFVGLNLVQSSFTGFCPLATILKKLGRPTGEAFS